MFITIECSSCHSFLTVRKDVPINCSCQKCGSHIGIISGSKDIFAFFQCSKCEKKFTLPIGKEVNLVHSCGGSIFSLVGGGSFSTVKVKSSSLKKGFLPLQKEKKVKILIPYFEGNPLVKEAVSTWIFPEVVFGLTDPGIIPPGSGVCSQLYSQKNATKIKGVKKTKPFLGDFLKRFIKLFPNEDFYGFFNSDVILPPGRSIFSLLPSLGKKIAFFHRLDIPPGTAYSFSGGGTTVFVGKDGFVCDKETLKKIIREFPDAIIGSPTWDSALTVWSWVNLGKDNVDMRYDEIWHAEHKRNWEYSDPDSIYNASLFTMSEKERLRIDWKGEMKKARKERKSRPKIGIVQPGRIGDIIITLPIAKWYHDAGYEVHWPVASEFFPLFEYVNYVKAYSLGSTSPVEAKVILKDIPILDLSIGFGNKKLDSKWRASGLSFDRWKYREAGVPFHNKYNLVINRNFKKERELKELLGLPNRYVVTHSKGTRGSFDFDVPGSVEVEEIEGFTLFDWIGVLEGASSIACVDSCVANLVEQLGIGYGRRYFHSWGDEHLCPVIDSDWGTPEEFQKKAPDPKLSFLMIVWNGMPFVEPCLEAIYDKAYEIFIVEGAVPEAYEFATKRGGSTDGTVQAIKKFPDPKKKIKMVNSKWNSRVEMQNYFMDQVSGDYVWQIDSDEIWKEEDIDKVIDLIKNRPSVKEVRFFAKHFFKGFDYCFEDDRLYRNGGIRRIFKFEPGAVFATHNPPTLRYTDGSLSSEEVISPEESLELGVFFYHYSYIYDYKVKQKVEMYSRVPHFSDVDHEGWYENFFSKWVPEKRKELEGNGYGPWPLSSKSHTFPFDGDHPAPIQRRMRNLRSFWLR